MLGSILIGLNAPAHGAVLEELGIRWAAAHRRYSGGAGDRR